MISSCRIFTKISFRHRLRSNRRRVRRSFHYTRASFRYVIRYLRELHDVAFSPTYNTIVTVLIYFDSKIRRRLRYLRRSRDVAVSTIFNTILCSLIFIPKFPAASEFSTIYNTIFCSFILIPLFAAASAICGGSAMSHHVPYIIPYSAYLFGYQNAPAPPVFAELARCRILYHI